MDTSEKVPLVTQGAAISLHDELNSGKAVASSAGWINWWPPGRRLQ